MSASHTLRMRTFGLRPGEVMPRYRRPAVFSTGTVRAKKESRRSGPGGGKICVIDRAKSA